MGGRRVGSLLSDIHDSQVPLLLWLAESGRDFVWDINDIMMVTWDKCSRYNPFGEDDDDFELNGRDEDWADIKLMKLIFLSALELIQRHLKVALNIVSEDELPPPLEKDIFWDQTSPRLEDFPRWDEAYLTNMYQQQDGNTYDTPEGHEENEFKTIQELRDPMAWTKANQQPSTLNTISIILYRKMSLE